MIRFGYRLASAALLVALAAGPAFAADRYWDVNQTAAGSGGTGVWNLSNLFWSNNSNDTLGPYNQPWSNAASDRGIFGGTAGAITLGAPITANALTFNTSGYTIGGNVLTLDGATPTITVTSGIATISSVIAGSAGLTKSGGGDLALSGANTFSGGVTVSAGRLFLNTASTFTGDINVSAGTTLAAASNAALGASANTITLNGGTLSATGALSASRQVIINGSASINGAGVGSALITGSGTLSVASGVSMTNDANSYTGQTTLNGSGTSGSTVWFTSVRNTGMASSLGASGDIVLQAVNNFHDGFVYIGDGDTTNRTFRLTPSSNGSLTLSNAGTGILALTGSISLEGSARGISINASTADIDLSGVISGTPTTSTLGLTGSAGRTITLGAANTYSTGTAITTVTVVASTLANIGTNSSLGTGSTNSEIGINGGTLRYTGGAASTNRTWGFANTATLRNDGSGGMTLVGAMQFDAGATVDTLALTGTYGGVNTLSGNITGSGGITANGAGTWVLSGANDYTGPITVEGGTLRAGSASALGASATATVNGGVLDLNGFSKTFTRLDGAGGEVALGSANLTLNVANGITATYAGSISGSGGLTKTGAGKQVLTGPNTYTGPTNVAIGTLELSFAGAGGPTSDIIFSSSTLNMSGGTLIVTGVSGEGNTQTFNGLNITGGGNKINATNTTLNFGAVTRTGGIIDFGIGAGTTMTVAPGTTLGGWATVNGSDYADVNASNQIVAFIDYDLKDNAATWVDGDIVADTAGAANSPFFGTVSDALGDNVVQLGGLRYAAAANSTVTVAAGQTLGVDGAIIVGPGVGSTSQTITGGSMRGAVGGVLGIQQSSAGTFTINSTVADNTGPTGLTVLGTGTGAGTGKVVLGNVANTYTGATWVTLSTLEVGTLADGGVASSIGASSADSANLVLETARLRYTGGTASTNRGLTLMRTGVLTENMIDVSQAATNLTVGGEIVSPDGASLTKEGAGTLTLTNTNSSYTGITTISAGTLAVTSLGNGGVNSTIGASSSDSANLVIGNNAAFRYDGANASSNRGFTLGSGSSGARVNVSSASTTLTLSGNAIGLNELVKEGAGTLILSGSNTYNSTQVAAGTLRAGSTTAFGRNIGLMTVGGGARLELGTFNNTVGALNGSGVVDLGSATLTLNTRVGDFTGTITGTGGLALIGAANQTLNGCNHDYAGSTSIYGSVLSTNCLADGLEASGIGASGAASGNLIIANNGTLQYTGGDAAIDRGFTLAGGWGYIDVTQASTELEFEGNAVGAGGLRKRGLGTLILSGTNTYLGSTVVEAGTLVAGSSSAFGTGYLYIDAGATVDMTGFSNTILGLSDDNTAGGEILIADKTLTLSNGSSAIFAGRITGTTGELIKNGTGVQALTGCTNSYGGRTVINGTLSVACLNNGGVNSSIGSSAADASNLVIGGTFAGGLTYTGTGGSTDRRFTMGNTASLRNNGTGAINFTSTAAITHTGTGARELRLGGTNTGTNILAAQIVNNDVSAVSLVKEEAGTWRLTNATNSYTGSTTINPNGGVLEVTKLANGAENSSIGRSLATASNLIIGTNATLRYVGSGDSTNRLFTLGIGTTLIESSGTGAINFTDSGGLMGFSGTGARVFTLGGTYGGDNIMGVTIRDQNVSTAKTSLAKNDAGTWILTANNTYTGNTVINAGKLIIGNGGTTGNVGTGEVILAFSTGTLGFNRSDTFSFAGKISGPGTIEQMGEGTTILTAVNTAGSAKISEGTLQVNGDLTTNTIVFEDDETTTLTVNGSVHGAAAAPAVITGDASANIITINAAGALTANGDLGGGSDIVTVSGTLATGASQLNLGDGNDTLVLNDTAVFTGAGVNAGTGTGDVLQVNNSAARTLAGSQVTGFESLTKTLGGILTLTGNHSFSAGTNVNAGTLIVDGTLGGGGPISIASGATFGGNGTAVGSVVIANGATLAPGSAGNVPGTLTVNGNLTLNSGTALAYNFGQANTVGGPLNDHTSVNGNLRLDGTLDMTVSPGGTFAPGFYRVITYTGGLDNQGLALGASVPSGVAVDTATSGQVNLLNTGGVTLTFWDGGTAGNHFDDVAQGGNGVWQSPGGNVNWTDTPGNGSSVNAPWTNAAFAIFQGSAGTVTVDNAPATVTTSGMQFRVDGYEIAGQPLTLVPLGAGNAVIRVGEGAATDSSITATISAELTGATGLTKTDGGRLVLAAANSYTGETVIAGGVIQVAAEDRLGTNTSMVLQGGTLNTTTSFALGRDISLDGPGGALDVNGATMLTVTGTVDGTGALSKLGTGTLVVTGSNSYSGGTNFNAGVVSIAASDNLGTGPLNFNGGTLQSDGIVALAMGGTINAPGGTIDAQPGMLTIGGNLVGAGALTKTGVGVLVLAGTNAYSGGTTISDGRLQLGDGGTTGSITGNVVNNAQLAFLRSDDYVFDGVISGTGSIAQLGTGATILTGTNTYDGPTEVLNGTLLVNGDQSGATGPTYVGGLLETATLGGTGTIGGDVTVFGSGTLAPGDVGNAPGTLTINGTLTLESNSTLAYNFGQPNVVGGANNDHTIVNGDLDMQGAELDVSVTPGGTFGPGIYRVITYTGGLTNNGLALGSVPADSDLFIDMATAGQVNLLNRFGTTLTYWDGDTNAGNGTIDGGDGVWQASAGNNNWTDNPSTLNASWTDEAFAIFQGAAGTVTIDNSQGAVTASGMQFLVNGYEIAGQPLTLVPWSSGTNAIIRVGSGAPDDVSITATISAELTGAAGLTKTDGGRLILTAGNSYTGATVIEGGVIQVAAESAIGTNSSLVLQGGTLNTTANFALGKNISLEGPGGALDVNDATTLELTGTLSGSGGLVKAGTGTLLQSIVGADTHTGATTVAQGTLLAGNAGVLSTASAYSVLAGATLDLDGFNQTIASLDNAGDVRLEGTPGTTLTVSGNYVGSGGVLYLNTQLGGDASPTDLLAVLGDTSGSSVLDVTNAGGVGAPTVEGIKVVDVGGTSAGAFTLQGDYVFEGDQAVVGGAYAYRLYQNGIANPLDGDWYLRSSLVDPVDPDPEEPPPPLFQPGVPLYEAYANVLQSFQKLETLRQRVGNRSWTPGSGVVEVGQEIEGSGLWGRIEANTASVVPEFSTAGIAYDVSNWRLEAGVDTTLSSSEAGDLVGGVNVQIGITSAAVGSVYGDGSIASTGYGLGATLTFYGSGGFYLDGRADVNAFDSTLTSATADLDLVEGNKGFGYALSLEAGQKVVLTDQVSMTPQAQLAYSAVHFDDFTDAFGADVSMNDGDSLRVRLGISADYETEWQDEAGEPGRTHLYGIANLYYELLEGSEADVSGTTFANDNDPLWGGVGLGGSVNWGDDKYSIFGEASANTSLGTIGQSYSLGATGGVRVKW